MFSNTQLLNGRLLDAVARRDEPKAFFVGNEYKAMPEKMRFCEDLGIALLVSQSSAPAVHALYRDRLGCAVIGLPNTGFDPVRFAPTLARGERPIDLGYRTERSPLYLGHTEREDLAVYFSAHAQRLGVSVDISMDRGDRFDETGWAAFLNRCKGQLGTEAGGDFQLTDRTRASVNEYQRRHPDVTAADVRRLFFENYGPHTPLRIMSGRHVEAAGTRTIQLLFRGHYDGYFRAGEHYIPLEKDFSNVDEALRTFRDAATSERIVENAYQVAMHELRLTCWSIGLPRRSIAWRRRLACTEVALRPGIVRLAGRALRGAGGSWRALTARLAGAHPEERCGCPTVTPPCPENTSRQSVASSNFRRSHGVIRIQPDGSTSCISSAAGCLKTRCSWPVPRAPREPWWSSTRMA